MWHLQAPSFRLAPALRSRLRRSKKEKERKKDKKPAKKRAEEDEEEEEEGEEGESLDWEGDRNKPPPGRRAFEYVSHITAHRHPTLPIRL